MDICIPINKFLQDLCCLLDYPTRILPNCFDFYHSNIFSKGSLSKIYIDIGYLIIFDEIHAYFGFKTCHSWHFWWMISFLSFLWPFWLLRWNKMFLILIVLKNLLWYLSRVVVSEGCVLFGFIAYRPPYIWGKRFF